MFERILAAADDSARGQLVMMAARALTERAGGALVLLRVRPDAKRDEVTEDDRALAEQTTAMRRAGIAAHYLVQTGAPEQRIIETAQRQQSTLIVIASRAVGPRALPGRRMTARLAIHAPAPVLVMAERGAEPHETQAFDAVAELFGRDDAPILVALDGSDLAEEALPYAVAMADMLRRPLVLTHVASPLSPPQQLAHAWAYVEGARRRVREHLSRDLHMDVQVVSGAPKDELLWAVESREAGMLVMTAVGKPASSATRASHIVLDTLSHLRVPALLIPTGMLESASNWPQPGVPGA